MTSGWLEQKERGSLLLTRFMVWLTLSVGRPVARLLLGPIALYFLLVGAGPRAASRAYLRRVLGREPGWRDLYRHFHTFASTILDRVHFLSGRLEGFEVDIEGAEVFDAALGQGRGLILLGAHFGSFDALRSIAAHGHDVQVNVLMHEANSAMIRTVFETLAPDMRTRIIQLGRPETFIRVKELLEAGEAVGLLADRGLQGEKPVWADFLGSPAPFPQGPMVLASLLRTPVIFFSAVYRGGRRYDVRLEPFADRVEIDRKAREAGLAEYVGRYATMLENHCRDAPYNWFNFYDFWAGSPDSGDAAPPSATSAARDEDERVAP